MIVFILLPFILSLIFGPISLAGPRYVPMSQERAAELRGKAFFMPKDMAFRKAA